MKAYDEGNHYNAKKYWQELEEFFNNAHSHYSIPGEPEASGMYFRDTLKKKGDSKELAQEFKKILTDNLEKAKKLHKK